MRSLVLPSGVLSIQINQDQDLLFDQLVSVGLRQNPKRGFLLISRVLGKHLPVCPSLMLESYRKLSAQIPASQVVTTFIGMAETATALGQGVFEAYAESIPGDLRFISSTRYPLDFPTLTFEETHSHSPSHFIHLTPENQAHFASSKRLVLIDDEISTGQTLLRLARAFAALAPNLDEIYLVSLTDFLGEQRESLLAEFPVTTFSMSLLHAGLQFEPDLNWKVSLPSSSAPTPHIAPHSGARVGCQPQGFVLPHIQALATEIAARESAVQVLGTGEFQFEPFLLALALEKLGVSVQFRATTRSPILEYGVINERFEFLDNYGEGISNYLYNDSAFKDLPIVACAETSAIGYLPSELGKADYFDFTKLGSRNNP
jgi:Phosphoribosyl transferase/TRSP domain C terminus to PRTase_2